MSKLIAEFDDDEKIKDWTFEKRPGCKERFENGMRKLLGYLLCLVMGGIVGYVIGIAS